MITEPFPTHDPETRMSVATPTVGHVIPAASAEVAPTIGRKALIAIPEKIANFLDVFILSPN